MDEIDAYHAAHPLDPGIPAQLLRGRLGVVPAIADAILDRELTAGALASSSGAISRTGWAPKLSGESTGTAQAILDVLATAGQEPPSSEELGATIGKPIDDLLRFLERRGDIVQVETGRYYTSDNLKLLIDRLRGLMADKGEVSPGELREGLQLSRKYLIPFLEYCDRVGYTNRNANGRVWRGP
jgi:selenocysteine-specific elongation factor